VTLLTSIEQALGVFGRSRLIIATTGLMVAAWVVNSILGFVFWWVASRQFSPEAVGLASATISASVLIARLTVSGLGTALAGFLPGYGGRRIQLIATALLIALVIGGVLGLLFAVIAPFFSAEYSPVVANLSFVALFGIGVGLAAAGVVMDQVLLSLRLGELQLYRNVIFAGGKLLFLVVASYTFGGLSALVIFGVWALGDAASFVAIFLSRRSLPKMAVTFEWRTVFGLARNAVGHGSISSARTGPALFMPVLVTGVLSATANAAFYVALIVTTALQVIASSATFTLYAVGERSPRAFQHQLRVTLALSSTIVAIGIAVLWVAGPWLLGLFGPTYVALAGESLPWLAACAIPLIIIDHWIALRRIRHEMRGTVTILVFGAVLQIALAWIGAVNDDVTGLAIGWFIGMCVTALLMIREVAEAALTSHPERYMTRGTPDPVDPQLPAALAVATTGAVAPLRLSDRIRTEVPAPTTTISVYIPVRNDSKWLPRAIESVLRQSYEHWELVIGDNASTEDIASVVAQYDDPRIRYHRFDHGVSILESWNRTAALCENDWVQSLAADDRIRPDCLMLMAAAIEWYEPQVPRLAMVLSSCRRVYPDGRSADRVWYGSKPKFPVRDGVYTPAEWLAVCTEDGQPPWQVGSVAVRREVVDESGGLFRPEVGLSADFESTMRMGAYGHVAYLTDELLDYTVRDDSDGPQRLQFNRASGVGDTVVGLAYQNALHVHDEVRGLTPGERRRLIVAISRSHLQRAAQHRVLPQGKGRSGAMNDVLRALRWSPRTVLRPSGIIFGAGAILAPRWLLEYAKEQMVTHLHREVPDSEEEVLVALAAEETLESSTVP
jgi:O-antigen/teichoic acid export membrane protein